MTSFKPIRELTEQLGTAARDDPGPNIDTEKTRSWINERQLVSAVVDECGALNRLTDGSSRWQCISQQSK
jgi:hypothetical protein